MKVLFLDIDGVLNCETTWERLGEEFGIYKGMIGIDFGLVERLKDWLRAHPEVKVVLSSTWRLDERMATEVRRRGIDFIGVTRNLVNRAREVEDWLAAHPEVTHYAILDDIQQFSNAQRERFVRTSYAHGLRPQDLAVIEVILEIGDARIHQA